MPLIFSTLTAANTYTGYKPGGGDLPLVAWEVTIKGGANVADRRTILTPRGIGTQVTDEQLELLRSNEVFNIHLKNGYITIDSARDVRDGDEAATKMEGRDKSAPDVEQDYLEEGKAAPVVNATVHTEVPASTPTSRRNRK